MSETMRERIARALMRRSEEQADGAPGVVDYWFTSGDPECVGAVAEYFDLADAVLAAVREPLDVMCHAGGQRWDQSEAASDEDLAVAASKVWRAMIDAASRPTE